MPEPNSGCWLWTRGGTVDGYGKITIDRREEMAHRVAWTIYRGPIPDGLWVLHRCDNPPCVNPEHLFLGTHRDNDNDKIRKRRHAHGETHGSAKLTAAQVVEIRTATGRLRDIGARYGVCAAMVHAIKHGKAWAHLDSSEAA